MPTLAEIQAKSNAALTALEKEKVREITGELPGKIDSLLPSGVSDLNRCYRADVDAWDALGDTTERLSGGRSGVDVDAGRDREHVRRRVRVRLGLPEVKDITTLDDPDTIGLFQILNPSWREPRDPEY
jgi:hypothetical protein